LLSPVASAATLVATQIKTIVDLFTNLFMRFSFHKPKFRPVKSTPLVYHFPRSRVSRQAAFFKVGRRSAGLQPGMFRPFAPHRL
jgi:hypothetical protein